MTFPPCPPWALACRWCHRIRRTVRDALLVCPDCDHAAAPHPAPKETR